MSEFELTVKDPASKSSLCAGCLDQPAMALSPNKRPIYLAPPPFDSVSVNRSARSIILRP